MDVAPLNGDEELVWRSLMRLVFTLPRALGDDLQRSCGLSSTEYSVLMHLSESPDGQLSMSELADRTNLSPSRISRVIAEWTASVSSSVVQVQPTVEPPSRP